MSLRSFLAIVIWFLGLFGVAGAAMAGQCPVPFNLTQNGTFDNALTGYTATGNWQLNQSIPYPEFATRAAVQNPTAAPTGADGAAYPVASLTTYAHNESDTANDQLTLPTTTADALYFPGELHLWFDLGWRNAGGSPTTAATLNVLVNGTSYLRVVTVAGNASGNANGTLLNGASFGANTPSQYFNPGAAGSFARWYTVHLVVPYTSSAVPNVIFSMAGGGGVSDDFSLDRIYVPMCLNTQLSTIKTLASSDPTPDEGDLVSYAITVNNSGPRTATNVKLTDLLPAGLTAASGNGVATLGSYVAGTGIWTIPTLTSGQSATLSLKGTVNAGQAGNTITNVITARAAGDQRDPTTAGDDLSESVTIAIASLDVVKTSQLLSGSHYLPGSDVLYSIKVTNAGGGAVDSSTVFFVDSLPPEITFYNANSAALGNARVGWTQTGANLTFSPVSDVRFSNQVAPPANFAQCTYAAASGYDPNIRHVCFRPQGAMQSGNPDPSFTVTFRARIE